MQEKPQQNSKKQLKGLDVLIICTLGLAILLCTYAYFAQSQASLRLSTLREERLEIERKHEKLLGYYVDMRRKSGYFDDIKSFSKAHGMNKSFVSAIIARESHYDRNAQSNVGARGLMQIMENSGDWIAKRLKISDYSYDRLFEAELNLNIGSWYLAYISNQFKGNPVMTAAAYHAGPRNVKLWALKFAKDKQTLEIDDIPKANTKTYVKKVMEAYSLYYEYDN